MLRIPRPILDEVLAHLKDRYPEEGCGLLIGRVVGKDRMVVKAKALKNMHDDPKGRYAIDPIAIFRVERSAESEGFEVLGVFHSHPDRPAEPSEHDRNTEWKGYSHLIAEVLQGTVITYKAWFLTDGKKGFVEEDVIIA